jgi:hypothetical protein
LSSAVPEEFFLHILNMAGLLFVTAPEANFKTINHALLCMRDWDELGGGLDAFRLVTDRASRQKFDDGTPLPLESLPQNVWMGATLEDIEAYCINVNRGDYDQKGANIFVIIDSEGIAGKTCILASMPDAYYEDPSTFHGRYDKIRVPWDDLYMIWCNLDIANMNFEEFVEEEEEGDDEGWFTYQKIHEDDDDNKAGSKRRNEGVEHWRQQGYI